MPLVVRLAGVLTQLACAACLLAGTIAFVLAHQNASDGAPHAVVWCVVALVGLVLGAFAGRGGVAPLAACALACATFGAILIALDDQAVGSLLRMLSGDDREVAGEVIGGAGIALFAIAAIDVVALVRAAQTLRRLRRLPAERPSMWQLSAASRAEVRSRRRLYFVLGGVAIGCGAGLGVLVTPAERPTGERARAPAAQAVPAPQAAPARPPAAPSLFRRSGPATPRALLDAQIEALSTGSVARLAATLGPAAIGFGTTGVALGRDAVIARLRADLGALADAPATVEATHLGVAADACWFAYDVAYPGQRFTVSAHAVRTADGWRVAAWHWATPVPDDAAERRAILGSEPPLAAIPATTGPLADAARAAFASRAAFVAARSDHPDVYNVGSALGERLAGPRAIATVFRRLAAELQVHGAVHAVQTSPSSGAALLLVDFTTRSRARTELRLTFRVLATFVLEAGRWRLVATHWSHPR